MANDNTREQLLRELASMGITCIRFKNGKSLANVDIKDLTEARNWIKNRQAKTCCDVSKEGNDK